VSVRKRGIRLPLDTISCSHRAGVLLCWVYLHNSPLAQGGGVSLLFPWPRSNSSVVALWLFPVGRGTSSATEPCCVGRSQLPCWYRVCSCLLCWDLSVGNSALWKGSNSIAWSLGCFCCRIWKSESLHLSLPEFLHCKAPSYSISLDWLLCLSTSAVVGLPWLLTPQQLQILHFCLFF